MTKKLQKALENHKKLWGWLAENPGTKDRLNYKYDWPGWMENGGRFGYRVAGCFMCDCVQIEAVERCEEFCLNWKSGPCNGSRSEFHLWERVVTPKTRAKYAAIIRDLPLKE